MRKRAYKGVTCLILFSYTLSGCATMKSLNTATEKTNVTAGIKSIAEAEERAQKLRVGVTSCPDGIKEAGFDTTVANVEHFYGPAAKDYYFGKDIQFAMSDPQQIAEILKDLDVWKWPIKETEKKTDRYYIHRQYSVTKGTETAYVIVCHKNILFSHGDTGVRIVDRPEIKTEWGGNILPAIIAAAAAIIFLQR